MMTNYEKPKKVPIGNVPFMVNRHPKSFSSRIFNQDMNSVTAAATTTEYISRNRNEPTEWSGVMNNTPNQMQATHQNEIFKRPKGVD